MGRGSANSLAPGFRFHPTDEELVRYYLKRKVSGMPFRFDPISEIDIYKIEPWDLPGRSKLKTRDLEWYFFSGLDKKYGNGSRTNRATEKGYWKTTGKDRAVMHNSRTVGMKKTLVFHRGRAPKGERSNWVMHEYRLAGEDLEKFGVVEDAVVLCRIFQKSGTGPKNGEHYGAPFMEEEWDDDSEEEEEEAFVPGEVLPPDEFVYDDPHGPEVYVEVNDVHQNIGYGISSGNAPQPLNFYYGEASHYFENSGSNVESDQKPVISSVETQCVSEQNEEQKFSDLPGQYDKPVKEEHSVDLINNVDSAGDDYLLDEPYVDAIDNNLASTDGLFLETNDLSNPIEPDAADYDMLEEYLAFFDAADDNMTFDPSQLLENNTLVNQTSLTQMDANGLNEGSQYNTEENGRAAASSSSKHNPEALKFEPDVKYPSFIKKASEMLGTIPAPPAFASEFPSKGAALRLSQLSQSPVNVTTGMIQIRNVSLTGNAMDWSFGKNGDLNVTLSFNLQSDVSPASSSGFMGKAGPGPVPGVSRSWLCLMFFWVLLLVSISFKVSSCIYTR